MKNPSAQPAEGKRMAKKREPPYGVLLDTFLLVIILFEQKRIVKDVLTLNCF